MAKLCMGCMNPLPEGSDKCSICGFPVSGTNPEGTLPIGAVLQGHYIVGRSMGPCGDGILYLGYDKTLKSPMFLHEFYPETLCQRAADGSVTVLGGCERTFADYLRVFRNNARALSRMKELSCLIPMYDNFEERGTAYSVSDYCPGVTLTKKLQQNGGRLPWAEVRPLFMSLMTGLTQLHTAGIRHLAINPNNILIAEDGRFRLRNFAIQPARCVGSDLKPLLETGYAAPEQYQLEGDIADTSDVYGLAATIFRTVTGNVPPAGNSRAKNSDDLLMPADVAEELSQQVCVALFNALQVDPGARTGTVAELHDQLSAEPKVSALMDEAEEDRADNSDKKKLRTVIIIFSAVVVALLAVVIVVLSLLTAKNNNAGADDTSAVVTTTTLPTTTTTVKKEKQYSVPALVGKNYYDVRDDSINGELKIVVKYKEYSEKAAGTILTQDPKENTSVGKGSTITLTISGGTSEKLQVPDVAGWPQEHAQKYLEALGFRVEIVTLQASDYDKGLVDSTDPAAGTTKREGDIITLRVSNVETAADPGTGADNTVTLD